MYRKLAAICLVLILTLCVAIVPTSAASEQQKLTASDGAAYDYFGLSVSISGSIALIGDPADESNAGSAYVFRYDGSAWVEEQKLTASDGVVFDWFGDSVSIDGSVALIGAPGDRDDYAGSAYVFRYDGSTWVEEQRLAASDGAAYDWFGESVSISNNTALIGASNNGYTGSAYVFRYEGSTWVEEQKLKASDGVGLDMFGCSVSLSGSAALIGAPYSNEYAGSAYVFRYDGSTWEEERKLTASDGAAWDWFGESLSLSSGAALVGALADEEGKGSAYVFRYDGSTWEEEQKLTASDGTTFAHFGESLSLSGDTALIGAPYSDSGVGSAHVFTYDGSAWVEGQKLTAGNGATGDQFGDSVSLSGNTALVGAPYSDNYTGSAYVFSLDYAVIPVNIDIRPRNAINTINMKSQGVIPVAILGSETFDVRDIDVATIVFGPSNARPVDDLTDPIMYADHLQDVNKDGYTDLIVHFRTQETGLTNIDTTAELHAAIDSVTGIVGSDSVKVKNG
jgi:hypothetical protein